MWSFISLFIARWKCKEFVFCQLFIMFTALMHSGILCFQVVVGQEFVVPPYSNVSLLQQPVEEDSDEELEYADSTSGIAEFS